MRKCAQVREFAGLELSVAEMMNPSQTVAATTRQPLLLNYSTLRIISTIMA